MCSSDLYRLFSTCFTRDVAIKAGVGIGTVSRALNGSGYISDETKQKIMQAVEELNDMGETTPFAGLFVKKADPEVLKDLDARGLLFDAPKFEHSYPHCWRCDTPLIYYARESWFIKMTEVKDDLIANKILSIGSRKALVKDVLVKIRVEIANRE